MSQGGKKVNKRRGVLICGAYGHGNAGDEAILEAVISEMRSIDPEIPVTVMSRTPAETAARCGVRSVHTFNILSFFAEARRCALYINGGGSLIQDVTSRRSLWFYLFTIRWAKRLGCGVIMYGCGIGPVTREKGRRSVRDTLNKYVDKITLRERHSLNELEDYGVTKPEIILASDPAMTLLPVPAEKARETLSGLGIDPDGSYIGICLRRWPGFNDKSALFAAAADYAFEKHGLTPVFVAINRCDDIDAAKTVAASMSAPYHIIEEPLDTAHTVGILAQMEQVLSMRLHGLIFAAGQGVPLVGVSYDPKVTAFLEYIGNEQHTEFDTLKNGELEPLIDKAAALRDKRAELCERAGALRKVESENVRAARELLGL